MVTFLTDEWVEALDAAAGGLDAGDAALDGIVVGYTVEGFAYHLVFGAGALRVVAGAAEQPTVTFRCDRPTAIAIARGESSAQRAFMAGQLRIGGDTGALLRSHGAVAALPDLFAAVRDVTDYGDARGA